MSLKELASKKVIEKIAGCTGIDCRRLLICDEYGLLIISSMCKMKELLDSGVSSVELLKVIRQPVKVDAIYFVRPTEESVSLIIQDFNEKSPLYLRAHVFFTNTPSKQLISKIRSSPLVKRLKTLVDSNLNFVVVEKNVFLACHKRWDAFTTLYGEGQDKRKFMQELSEELTSLCVTLGCKPTLICQRNSENVTALSSCLSDKLKTVDFEGAPKSAKLLILERFFDGVSTLIHELTLQAMAGDLLNLTDNLYKYKNLNGHETTSLMDESNEMWTQQAHRHIADVLHAVPSKIKEVASQNKMKLPTNKGSLSDLKTLLSKLPQYKAELNKYQVILNLAESCMQQFESRKLADLCAIEQDIATGTNKEGEPVVDPVAHMLPILQGDYRTEEKLRMVLLYALSKEGGISLENLERIIDHGKLRDQQKLFSKFRKCGISVLENDGPSKSLKRPHMFVEGRYTLSRFVPSLKTLMEEVISNNYPPEDFVETSGSSGGGDTSYSGNMNAPPTSFKFGKWNNSNTATVTKSSDTLLIVFVIGGITLSEIRCAHEVGGKYFCDVILGGTQIHTPERFIKSVSSL